MDWVSKELTWQRAKWTGIFHGYLNFQTSEEEILRFQMRTASSARNSRQDLSTAIAVLINGESSVAHEKLNTLELEIKRWTRPIGSFFRWQSSHTKELLGKEALSGLEWDLQKEYLRIIDPDSTIKYKKLFKRGIRKRWNSRLTKYAPMRICK